KDTEFLFDAYWQAGVTEYWLVDARQDPIQFDIFRHTVKEYKRAPKKHAWVTSRVFGKSFRLSVTKKDTGHPEYTLDMR
ncbi:MAG TPA: hypothetical protein VKE40_05185, partial [Gemmataceae bacterium]|nr:hypothetical protein [Gemmataceae bacterium]